MGLVCRLATSRYLVRVLFILAITCPHCDPSVFCCGRYCIQSIVEVTKVILTKWSHLPPSHTHPSINMNLLLRHHPKVIIHRVVKPLLRIRHFLKCNIMLHSVLLQEYWMIISLPNSFLHLRQFPLFQIFLGRHQVQ